MQGNSEFEKERKEQDDKARRDFFGKKGGWVDCGGGGNYYIMYKGNGSTKGVWGVMYVDEIYL